MMLAYQYKLSNESRLFEWDSQRSLRLEPSQMTMEEVLVVRCYMPPMFRWIRVSNNAYRLCVVH